MSCREPRPQDRVLACLLLSVSYTIITISLEFVGLFENKVSLCKLTMKQQVTFRF